MKEKKFIWIYPKQCMGRLGSTSIFYGTEKEYKEDWKKDVGKGRISYIMKNTLKFVKAS